MKFKVAVVQFDIKQFLPENNLVKAERFIKKASTLGARIIVFPEDFVTGPIETRLDLADKTHAYRKIFQDLAKKYRIDIVPGSFIEKDKNNFYNTTYYIDSLGLIKLKYRKIHLWHPERKDFSPGHRIAVGNSKYGKIGLIICWDLMFPEIFRDMVRRGVKIVICPSYWTLEDASVGLRYDKNSEVKLIDALCVSRASENEIILIYCNAAGRLILPKFKARLFGHSQIATPFRGAIKKLEHNKEAMFVQEINTDILKDAERAYKIRKDLKNKLE